MKLPTRPYPAKVILFGEYTVLLGGDILAVPYTTYAAHWSTVGEEIDSRLLDFIDYLTVNVTPQLSKSKLLDLRTLVSQGTVLESNIKVGAGLGSSGSVVAAVYDVCKVEAEVTTADLLDTFVKMESYFHGSSSGIDPLVSYTQSVVHKSGGDLHLINDINLPQFTLYDSEVPRHTQELVKRFKKKFEDDATFSNQVDAMKTMNNTIITDLLTGKWYLNKLKELSNLQFTSMDDYIPDHIKALWQIEENGIFKICGAGGGGYFLRFKD